MPGQPYPATILITVSLRLTAQEVQDLRRDMQESHRLMVELVRAGRQSRPGRG